MSPGEDPGHAQRRSRRLDQLARDPQCVRADGARPERRRRDGLTITSTFASQRGIVAGFDLISNGTDAPLRLAFSFDTRWAFDPGLSGVRLFGPQARRIPLGTIPGNGTSSSLPVPAL